MKSHENYVGNDCRKCFAWVLSVKRPEFDHAGIEYVHVKRGRIANDIFGTKLYRKL